MQNHSATRYLGYLPPYDWESVLSVFRAHQLPHLEAVDHLGYERIVKMTKGVGWFRVVHHAKRNALCLSVWNGSTGDVERISDAVRRMFDLDADPAVVRAAMNKDAYLSSAWARHPGLRVARSWSGFETMLTTVLGQLVSVRFARTLTDELMRAAGPRGPHPKTKEPIYFFPTAKQLLKADLGSIRTSQARRIAIQSLATLVAEGAFKWKLSVPPDELRKTLLSVPGIGLWTSEYIAMRGFHDDDAFPKTDYGLKQALQRHPEVDVECVRPWRAYAAALLWKSFAEAKGITDESVV